MMFKGTAVSPGIGMGKACRYAPEFGNLREVAGSAEPDRLAAFRSAVQRAAAEISRLAEELQERAGAEEAGIIRAQLIFLEDPLWLRETEGLISAGMSPPEAVVAAAEKFAAVFMASGDRLLQERVADIRDVAARIAGILCGPDKKVEALSAGVVLVADEIYPSLMAALDPVRVRGLVTGSGGYTSHAAIIARALGIPAVMGVAGALIEIEPGAAMLIDGEKGEVWVNPDEAVLHEYREKIKRRQGGRSFTAETPVAETVEDCTRDGTRILITANAGTLAEAKLARARGAAGIGLYRTEYAYLQRGQWPTEDELYAEYAAVTGLWVDGEVVFRTFDLGGDKLPGYISLPREDNPMLGIRGIRVYRYFTEHFSTQLRALLRVAGHGRIKIMVPMVTCLDEFRWVCMLLQEAQRLSGCKSLPPLGLMVEVPATAVLLSRYETANFFSLGTNDLVQYMLAGDRTQAALFKDRPYFHPGFLKILQIAVADAGAVGRPISICGEMAGDLRAVLLLLGVGVRAFSVGVDRLTDLRKFIGGVSLAEGRKIARKASQLATAQEVDELLKTELPGYKILGQNQCKNQHCVDYRN